MFAHLFAVLLSAQPVSNDIDVFMAKVLEKREINWEDYRNYFCRERAELSIEGALAAVPIQGTTREFFWYVRDGYMVRSPVSVDGVEVSPEERDAQELAWIERLKQRESRGPDREGFLGFEFEPGRYLFAGRQEFEGREVYAIEYYPEDAFGDDDDEEDDDDETEEDEAEDAKEREFEAKFNKVLLVTMLIDPKDYQIVHMTLDNVGFDFLPAKWLVQVDTLEASMTMHQPFAPLDEVWLSRDIKALGRITTAAGDIGLRYETSFFDCARAETSTTFEFPKPPSTPKPETKPKKKK